MSAPIAIKVTRFVCPYCRRGHSARSVCAGHIGRCFRNPANKACKTCVYYGAATSGDAVTPGEAESCAWENSDSIPAGCSTWEAA